MEKDIISIISGSNKFKSEDWIKENLSSLHFFIDSIDNDGRDWKEKLYLYLNQSETFCECGNKLEFISLSKGYRKFCSVKCQSNSKSTKDKRSKTSLGKWGVVNPMMSSDVKEKYKSSMLEKYSVDNPSKLEHSKNKVKETNLKKFGVEYLSQLDSVKKSLSDKMKDKTLRLNSIKNEILKSNIQSKILNTDIDFLDIKESSIYLMSHEDHQFEIHKNTLNDRLRNGNVICTICNKIESGSDSEKNLLKFIKDSYGGEVLENVRGIIKGEIDIYLPTERIGFEFNGIFWHSDRYKSKKFHLDKTESCDSQDIKLIHIWEDDWKYKRSIIESRILNLLGKSKKVWARSCKIKIIDNIESNVFLDVNHLQGSCPSKVRIGLYHKNNLVSLMTFGGLRRSLGQNSSDGEYELLRYCNLNGYSVVGGASKILKYFINNYSPKSIISYADRSWSSGNLYKRLGFKFCHNTDPNYYWVVNDVRRHRFNYRKDKLVKEGFDSDKSESQIMNERGYYRIWDCGSSKFIYNL